MTGPRQFISRAKVFLIDAGERVLKSAASGAALVLVARGTDLTGAIGVGDWGLVKTISITVGNAAALGGLSVVTSLISKWRTGTASASKTVAISAVVPAFTAANVIEQASPHAPEHAADSPPPAT